MKNVDDIFNKYHLRKTIQRTLILQYLLNNHDHPSAETIYQMIQDKGLNISLATIYKNLNQLVSLNIVKAIQDSDDLTHYDLNNKTHYHLICKNCGKIIDANYPEFEYDEQKMLNTAYNQGFTDLTSDINIYGICSQCQKLSNHNLINNSNGKP